MISKTLAIVARARGMARVAADVGTTHEGAYAAVAPDRDHEPSTTLDILAAPEGKLSATMAVPKAPADRRAD